MSVNLDTAKEVFHDILDCLPTEQATLYLMRITANLVSNYRVSIHGLTLREMTVCTRKDKLPKSKVQCKICFDNIDGWAVRLPCMHQFCRSCAIGMLQQKNECCLCRTKAYDPQ